MEKKIFVLPFKWMVIFLGETERGPSSLEQDYIFSHLAFISRPIFILELHKRKKLRRQTSFVRIHIMRDKEIIFLSIINTHLLEGTNL